MGVYPYEVDYAKGGDKNLTLTMTAGGAPIPAAVLLTMTPSSVPSTTVDQPHQFVIAATDADGAALANMPVTVNVTGPNQESLSFLTDATGQVMFAYSGYAVGTDIVQAEIAGPDGVAYSNAVSATWNSGVNQAPAVEAGLAQTVTLATPVTLSGTVSDDGLPNGMLTLTWSMVSGPGR